MPETETAGSQSLCLSLRRCWDEQVIPDYQTAGKSGLLFPTRQRRRSFEKSLFRCHTAGLHSVVLILLPTPGLACALGRAGCYRSCFQPHKPKVRWCLSLRMGGVIGEPN